MSPDSPRDAPAPKSARVLIVDDTPGNLSLLVDALQSAGHRPIVATSGPAALQRIAEAPPELILLDMKMPGMDGLTVCATLQAQPAWSQIPVIFMTAVEEPEQKVAAFTAGAVDYVTKPFHPAEVMARIGAHLRIKALQTQLAEELAWRAETEKALAASLEHGVIVALPDGRIPFLTHRAGYLLRAFFPELGDTTPRHLPATLASRLAAPGGDKLGFDGESGRLEARIVGGIRAGDPLLIMLELKRREGDYLPLRKLGLSEREAEVLYWISQGKTNPEIGIIIGAATATVKKHTENIYLKLGVTGRADALLLAVSALRES